MSAEYRITTNGQNVASDIAEIIIDTVADLENVPTDFGSGSSLLCLEDSSVYVLGIDKEWHKI